MYSFDTILSFNDTSNVSSTQLIGGISSTEWIVHPGYHARPKTWGVDLIEMIFRRDANHKFWTLYSAWSFLPLYTIVETKIHKEMLVERGAKGWKGERGVGKNVQDVSSSPQEGPNGERKTK